MILHEDISFHRHIVCKDIHNKPLEAGVVFKHCIMYLRKHISEQLEHRFLGIRDDEIEIVLTVPAMSGEKAKMFMREAALNAGIKKENLSIVLETEAASIYCQYLTYATTDSTPPFLGVLKPGTKYILADIGGDRVDITVHQKCEDNTLEEILPASRGPWGGKSVDDKFISFLKELFGKEVLEKFKKDYTEEYLEMVRKYESSKSQIKTEKNGKTRMPIPQKLQKLCIESCGVENFKEVILKNDKHKNNLEVSAGKLAWDNNFFRGFFKKSIDGIVKHFDDVFQESEAREINIIVMVGGFSNCLLVQDAIRRNFKKATVIIPEEAELAVLKGAVYFGHIPDAVSRRSARYTYGIQTWPEFKDGIHPKEKRVESGQSILCKDVFTKIVTKGEKVMPGCTKSQIIEVLKENESETVSEIRLFISDSKNPKFVDEQDCLLVGILQVQLPSDPMCKLRIQVSMIFGEADLKFQAKHAFSENPERLWSTYDQYREKNQSYKMESNPRGVLLLINNSKYEKYCGELLGMEHDCKKLKDLFSVLGFKVLVKENLRASEMLSELQIFAKNQLLAQVDCMVLAVLSHGTTDVMCGTDGVGIDVMKSIVPIFSAIECPNLRGKPKMFICNACRGDATSQSIDIVPIKINVNRRIQLDDPDNSTLGTKHNIEYQDIVMCFSTFPGYESYTNLEEGSLFIQEFVSVFKEHSHHTHVLDMLTKINKKVSQKEYKEHATGSTCVQTSTLTDSWYLINTSVCCRFEPLSTEFSNVIEL